MTDTDTDTTTANEIGLHVTIGSSGIQVATSEELSPLKVIAVLDIVKTAVVNEQITLLTHASGETEHEV